MEDLEIACPKCNWEPDGGAHWQCTCGHVWNTFDTAARCPSCRFQWKDTQCIDWVGGCGQSSPHLDWYRNLDELLREELEALAKESKIEVA